jgi:transposase
MRLVFLPPYTPEFNPIEKEFYSFKTELRKKGASTVDELTDHAAKIL